MKRVIANRWWLGGGVALVLAVAFAIGVYFGPVGAQEIVDDPDPVVSTPSVPYEVYGDEEDPDIGFEVVYETVTTTESEFYVSSTLGSATKPTSGKWVYLSKIRRYISLPNDVVYVGTAIAVECQPGAPYCADAPVEYYRKGSAEVGIDQSVRLFGSESDKAAFPFFQGLKEAMRS